MQSSYARRRLVSNRGWMKLPPLNLGALFGNILERNLPLQMCLGRRVNAFLNELVQQRSMLRINRAAYKLAGAFEVHTAEWSTK
jgi:hypothetical protein